MFHGVSIEHQSTTSSSKGELVGGYGCPCHIHSLGDSKSNRMQLLVTVGGEIHELDCFVPAICWMSSQPSSPQSIQVGGGSIQMSFRVCAAFGDVLPIKIESRLRALPPDIWQRKCKITVEVVTDRWEVLNHLLAWPALDPVGSFSMFFTSDTTRPFDRHPDDPDVHCISLHEYCKMSSGSCFLCFCAAGRSFVLVRLLAYVCSVLALSCPVLAIPRCLTSLREAFEAPMAFRSLSRNGSHLSLSCVGTWI